MQFLKVGLIGAGVFGGYHAGKIAASVRTDFAGIFDPDTERAKTLSGKHETQAFGLLEDLFSVCDAVLVACPATYHEDMVGRAIDAGLHVLVEKPLALNGAAAVELARRADAKGVVLQVGHQERLVMQAMGFFDIEEKPLMIEAFREGPPAPDGRAGDVSVIWDLMIHDLDLVARLMGRAEAVSGQGTRHHSEHIDAAMAQLQLAEGGRAVVTASRAADTHRRQMKLVYPSGQIDMNFLTRTVVNTTGYTIKADISKELPDPLGAADEAFFAACLGERETPIPGREAAEAVRLAELVETTALQTIGA